MVTRLAICRPKWVHIHILCVLCWSASFCLLLSKNVLFFITFYLKIGKYIYTNHYIFRVWHTVSSFNMLK